MGTDNGLRAENSLLNVEEQFHFLRPPGPILVVEKVRNMSIYVKVIYDSNGDNIVISSSNYTISKTPFDKYKSILFEKCSKVKIYIDVKVLKVCLVECTDSSLIVNKEIVGMLEIHRCDLLHVDIRNEIPIVQIGQSAKINITQYIEKCIYALQYCIDVSCYIHPSKIFQLICDMFGVQNLFLVARNDEPKIYREMYNLNEIELNFLL